MTVIPPQDCLYHHPVHKISFIAQDMTDTRAFGYIFGSPDAGHKFFGIKTEKAASQVVIAMRDLFQVSSQQVQFCFPFLFLNQVIQFSIPYSLICYHPWCIKQFKMVHNCLL